MVFRSSRLRRAVDVAACLLILSLLVGCGRDAPSGAAGAGPPGGAAATPAAGDLVTVPVRVPDALKARTGAFGQSRELNVPAGFEVSLMAAGLKGPRLMAYSPSQILYVSQPEDGSVLALPDPNGQGVVAEPVVVARGLNGPHGLAFHAGYLYIAENHRVSRLPDPGAQPGGVAAAPEAVVDLVSGGGHSTRTIGFGPDGKLYVAAGSSCNVCEEKDERRAAISQFNPDGSEGRIYARGLRNSVGFVWRPGTPELWATDNGRDNLGDDLPPDEVNIIVDGGDYGWPYCYGDRQPNPEFKDQARCDGTIAPTVPLQAHSAALGLRFYDGTALPNDYLGDLLVAYHGSWNRTTPTGYKLVRIHTAGYHAGDPAPAVEDFITGWRPAGKDAWGRPVDVMVAPDGALLVTDDKAGVIYRVTYRG